MTKLLLIVEDDKFISELLSNMMKQSGYAVLYSPDAEGGEKLLKLHTPDIILLDILLPGMNGFEFLKRAKADEKTRDIPVIILSNLGSDEDITKGMELGADAYLVKANFIMADIVTKVEEILQKKARQSVEEIIQKKKQQPKVE